MKASVRKFARENAAWLDEYAEQMPDMKTKGRDIEDQLGELWPRIKRRRAAAKRRIDDAIKRQREFESSRFNSVS